MNKFAKGQIGVIMTLAIVAIIGAMALCGDVAILYLNWMRLQKAGDAGALAGAAYLQPSPPALPTLASGCAGSSADSVACTYAVANSAKASEATVTSPAADAPATLPANSRTIEVKLTRLDVPAYFSRVLGATRYPVITRSIAMTGPANAAGNGLFPVGMPPQPNNAPLVYGQVVTLGEGVSAGNWEFLNIPNNCTGASCASTGGGAPLLASNIENGCNCSVSVGDSLYPKSGIGWGPVSAALATRIPNPGQVAPSTLTGNEPNLVTVPITAWDGTQGTSTPVKISGFAVLWLVDVVKHGSTISLTAQFIQYESSIASAPGGPDYGAYIRPMLIQ